MTCNKKTRYANYLTVKNLKHKHPKEKRIYSNSKTGRIQICLLLIFFSFCRTTTFAHKEDPEDRFFLTNIVLDKIQKHQTKDSKFQNVICPMSPSCSHFVKEEFETSNFLTALFFSINRILYVENRLMHEFGQKRYVYKDGRGKLIDHKPIDQSFRDFDSFKRDFTDD
ncbi:membrane protein insertion efficiency factor YidD [Leptospira licerasiae]|nr:membrane protein insertion efficiency factor YidD [Leptospira licerasiae]